MLFPAGDWDFIFAVFALFYVLAGTVDAGLVINEF